MCRLWGLLCLAFALVTLGVQPAAAQYVGGAPLPVLQGQQNCDYVGATLVLDFTGSKSNGQQCYRVNGAVTHGFGSVPGLTSTRALTNTSISYAETSAGLLVPFAANVPRITDKGLLVEESRPNLAQQSQALSTSPWINGTPAALTINPAAAAAPDGTLTAASFVPASGAVNADDHQAVTVTSATAYTCSIYLKNGSLGNNWVEVTTVSSTTARTWFNLSTGVVGTIGATTANIRSLTNGWYRVDVTVTTGATSLSLYVSPRDANNNSTTVTGNGSSPAMYAWGAQIELGSFATSYIPTTSASATRGADSVSIGGLSLVAPVTMYGQATYPADNTSANKQVVNLGVGGDTGNRLYIYRSTGASLLTEAASGNVTVFSAGAAASGSITAAAAMSHDGTTYRAASLGVAATPTAAAAPVGTMSVLSIGIRSDLAATWLNGYVRKVLLYPTAFGTAQLQSITQ